MVTMRNRLAIITMLHLKMRRKECSGGHLVFLAHGFDFRKMNS